MFIVGLISLSFVGPGDISRLQVAAEECRQQYTIQTGRDIPRFVDTVEIHHREITSSVSFLKGSTGAVGERDESYQLYLVCSVINKTNEVILLTKPMEAPWIKKNVSEQDEHSRDYVGNEEKYFNVILFSYQAGGVLTYQSEERYSNLQLFEHYIEIGDPEPEAEKLPEENLFGQWLNVESWDRALEQQCWLSVSFSPDGSYVVMNDCYGNEPYNITERGSWLVKANNITLHERIFYHGQAFLADDEALKLAFEIVGDDLFLYTGTDQPKEVLSKVVPSAGPFSKE